MNCGERPYCTFTLTVLAGGWVLTALFAGETGLLGRLPAAAIPAAVWVAVAALLAAYFRSRAFRAFVDELGIRVLLAVHLTRFVGFYFLHLGNRGELPAHFASAAGWGNIVIAAGAVALLLRPARGWLLAWNVAGLAEILLVVFSAASHMLRDRASMTPFATLPLSFLPTMVAPLIIATHLAMIQRLRRGEAGADRSDAKEAAAGA